MHLHLLCTKLKPKIVLEFGLGASTILIAETLRAIYHRFGKRGKVISFEQSPDYYDLFMTHFPDELSEYVEPNLKRVGLKWFGNYRGIFYYIDEFPKYIDLVYIDGATRTRGCPESDFVYRRLNADIVRMKNRGVFVKYAVTDGRYANYPFYFSELSSDCNVRLSKLWNSIIITPK